jgi:RNA polymerase sigma factor (sigma-70 family)
VNAKLPFERVLEEHGPTVLRVCRTVLGMTDADDAWSETFLAALRAYPTLPATANVEAWLVTIAHHKSIDVLRVTNRLRVDGDEMPEVPARASTASFDDTDLWESVQQLPTKQRQAIAYHYIGGLSFVDVAGILGGSSDAARRASADGIKKLRTMLNNSTTKGLKT